MSTRLKTKTVRIAYRFCFGNAKLYTAVGIALKIVKCYAYKKRRLEYEQTMGRNANSAAWNVCVKHNAKRKYNRQQQSTAPRNGAQCLISVTMAFRV